MNDERCLTVHLSPFEAEPPANPQLTAVGWQRRFTADPIRAEEAIQLYTELGYEVRLETIQPSELSPACGDCRLATCIGYQTIYTRKKTIWKQ